jgi:hypothetical protein
VLPVTIVYFPKATIRKKVKIHDSKRGQISSMPYAAPADAIVVILPVPILYPIKKSPGAIVDRKSNSLFLFLVSISSLLELFGLIKM